MMSFVDESCTEGRRDSSALIGVIDVDIDGLRLNITSTLLKQ